MIRSWPYCLYCLSPDPVTTASPTTIPTTAPSTAAAVSDVVAASSTAQQVNTDNAQPVEVVIDAETAAVMDTTGLEPTAAVTVPASVRSTQASATEEGVDNRCGNALFYCEFTEKKCQPEAWLCDTYPDCVNPLTNIAVDETDALCTPQPGRWWHEILLVVCSLCRSYFVWVASCLWDFERVSYWPCLALLVFVVCFSNVQT